MRLLFEGSSYSRAALNNGFTVYKSSIYRDYYPISAFLLSYKSLDYFVLNLTLSKWAIENWEYVLMVLTKFNNKFIFNLLFHYLLANERSSLKHASHVLFGRLCLIERNPFRSSGDFKGSIYLAFWKRAKACVMIDFEMFSSIF